MHGGQCWWLQDPVTGWTLRFQWIPEGAWHYRLEVIRGRAMGSEPALQPSTPQDLCDQLKELAQSPPEIRAKIKFKSGHCHDPYKVSMKPIQVDKQRFYEDSYWSLYRDFPYLSAHRGDY